jgi:acetylornithine/N-succinyldiaminopimelate aminotransferase
MVGSGERSSAAWAEVARRAFTPNVAPAPVVLERGEGCYVWDVEGRRYLDAISGIAVSALGHGHRGLAEAVADQAKKLLHTSNLFLNAPAVALAERLTELSSVDRVFFCNSGAEANEAAIKLARRYAHLRGQPGRNRILTFRGGFHGRTYGALAATAQPKYHEGFGPMPEGFDAVDYGDAAAVEASVSERTAAILVEPIQGEGGVNVPPAGFLRRCREVADATGALLICDEVQTGFGRTGRLFAHEHEGVTPDVLCMAKGIAAGLPLGAVGARSEVAEALGPGTHNTTYSGNPVACRAAHVVLDELTKPGVLDAVEARGAQLRRGLAALGVFGEVRGRGLLVGAELAPELGFSAKDIVAGGRARGALLHVAGPSVLRLAPPLILDAATADALLAIIRDAVEALRSS